jgi:hypothetical protein
MARENLESMEELTAPSATDALLIQDDSDTDTNKYIRYEDFMAPVGYITSVTLTSAQILALNATPITLLDAPGADKAWIVKSVTAIKPAGTAYAGIAAGEDLTLRYTNGSGAIASGFELTGFLDQTTKQVRHAYPQSAVGTVDPEITPVENAAIVAHILTGEIITGDTDLILRIEAALVDTSTS